MTIKPRSIGMQSDFDDAVAFFECTGIYHRPYCHHGRHYVVGEQFTETELLAEMRRILATSPLKKYLACREDQLARYYFTGIRNGFKQPLYVWVAEVEGERQFHCVYIDRKAIRLTFPRRHPHHSGNPIGGCSVVGCNRPAMVEVKTGLFSMMALCPEHERELTPIIFDNVHPPPML